MLLMNVSLIAVKLNRTINNKFIYMFCHFAQAYAPKQQTQTQIHPSTHIIHIHIAYAQAYHFRIIYILYECLLAQTHTHTRDNFNCFYCDETATNLPLTLTLTLNQEKARERQRREKLCYFVSLLKYIIFAVYIISENISQRRKPFCLRNDLRKSTSSVTTT